MIDFDVDLVVPFVDNIEYINKKKKTHIEKGGC